MGCWNETCLVSNLPITVGDEVAMILLVPSHSFINGCGYRNNDFFKPCCLPIFGEYNDYGSVENITNDNYALEYLKILREKKVLNFKWKGENLEQLLSNNIIGTRVKPLIPKRYHSKHKVVITKAFIKKEFYDLFVAISLNNQNYYDKDESSANIKEYLLKGFHQGIEKNKEFREMVALRGYDFDIDQDLYFALYNNLIGEFLLNVSLDKVSDYDLGFFIRKYLETLDSEFLEQAANFILVNLTMIRLGKTWIPINTASQEEHYDEHKQLTDLMLKVIDDNKVCTCCYEEKAEKGSSMCKECNEVEKMESSYE